MSRIDEAIALVAAATYADPARIGPDAHAADTPGWDSIAHVNIMMALEERAGGSIPVERVAGLVSVAAIADFLAALEERDTGPA